MKRALILIAVLAACEILTAQQRPLMRLGRAGDVNGIVLPPVVENPPVITTSTPLPSCTQNSSYTGLASMAVDGGTAPLSFALSTGSLPTGLSLNGSTGAITGTCSGSTGASSFTVCVTDALTAQDCQAFSLTVVASGPATAHTYFDARCGDSGIQRCVSWRSQASVDAAMQAIPTTSFDIESMVRSGSTVTVTTAKVHGAIVGGTATITRSNPTDYNGVKTIVSVPTPTTFTFTISGTPAQPVGEALQSGTAAAHTSGVESCTITLTGSPAITANDDALTLNGGAAINGTTVSQRRVEAFSNNADVFTIDDTGGCPTIAQGAAVDWQSYYVPQVSIAVRSLTYGLGTDDYTQDTHSEKQDGVRIDIPNRPPEFSATVNTNEAHTMGAASCTIYFNAATSMGTPNEGWITLDFGRPIGGVTVDRRNVQNATSYSQSLGEVASSVTASGTTVTFDGTGSNHTFSTGNVVTVSGAAQSEYNGTFTITVVSANRFTYTALSAPSVSPATGTIRADRVSQIVMSDTGGCPSIPLASPLPWRTYKFPERHIVGGDGDGQMRHFVRSDNATATEANSGSILIGWENYWTADFLDTDNFDGLSIHKGWQISDGGDTLYFEIRPDYDQAVDGVSVATLDARFYQGVIGNMTQGDPSVECGTCYTPYTIPGSKWVRFWLYIDLEASATNHHKAYLWAWAQGDSSATTIFNNLSLRKQSGGVKKFWWEGNTSQYASTSSQDTLTQYSRNLFTITGLSLAQAQALLEAPPQ